MYNVATITEALRGLVGFRAHHDENLDEIDADIQVSRSGLYVDKAHPLITAENLNGAAVVVTPFEPGQTPLNAFIRQALDDSVGMVLSALRTRKLLRYEAKTLLPVTQLYEGEGSLSDLVQPAGRFVGLRITTNDAELAVNVRRLGLQFTFPISSLPIYVVTGYGSPVQAQVLNYTYSGRMQWLDTNIVLSGANRYVIGYYETDITGSQAIRRNKAIGKIACGGCEPANATLWNRWKSFVSVDAVRQDSLTVPFDVMESQNFGLNLALSVGCDIGPFIIAQQANMAEAIQQQAVVKLLSELAYTTQITTVEQQTRQNAMYALQTTETAKLERLLDALDIDFSGLSDKCLPDTQGNLMPRRRTVFNV